ncbi:hypothetical protein BC629DRAFT_1554310 [Irpex lacteus]|nr:hypothetical protein BC629DRAFT_1554310 [Irpex lacteus]
MLPLELSCHIVSYIDAEQDENTRRATLLACAFVSQDFKGIAHKHLFRSVALVLIDVLDDETEATKYPPLTKRSKGCFFRYIQTIEDATSYILNGRIAPYVRRVTLDMDHPRYTGPNTVSRNVIARIARHLEHLQHLSLIGVSVMSDGGSTLPMLPPIQELSVGCWSPTYDAGVMRQPLTRNQLAARLASICALFDDIPHLIIRFPWVDYGEKELEDVILARIQAVTILDCMTLKNVLEVLQLAPLQGLRAFHLPQLPAQSIPYVSAFLSSVGTGPYHVTLGGVIWGSYRLHGVGVTGAYVSFSHSYSGQVPSHIELPECSNLRTIRVSINVSSWNISDLKLVSQAVLRYLPPSVKVLEIAIKKEPPDGFGTATNATSTTFWRSFESELVASIDRGLEKVSIAILEGSLEAYSCTDREASQLRSYFPRLVEKSALVFPRIDSRSQWLY